MSHTFKAPFSSDLVQLNPSQVKNLMAQAESGQVKSLDHIDLRMHALSDERGFLTLDVVFDADEMDVNEIDGCRLEDFMDVLGDCQVRGVRGQRAVLVQNGAVQYGDEIIVRVLVGRNVWFNKHRMTAGFPANEDQIEDVLSDLRHRVFDAFPNEFIDVRVQSEDLSREDAIALVERLEASVKSARDALSRYDVNPKKAISDLSDLVVIWGEDAQEALHD